MFFKTYKIQVLIAVIGLILLWTSANISWGKENWKGMLEADAKGYYAYLPATFIYGDFNFTFLDSIERKYDMPQIYYNYRQEVKGGTINKYFLGTSILQLPFFALAHGITYFTNGDLDGYSKWYMILINIASIFYHLLGLYFLFKLLRLYQLKDITIAILLLACSFATNLFVYTVIEPGMSHVYSFGLVAGFLLYAKQYFTSFRLYYLALMSFVLVLIVLVRPINLMIILALPFMAGGLPKLLKGVSKIRNVRIWYLPLAVLGSLALLSLQLIAYYLATGNFFTYSYQEEGFNFLDPHFFDILLSYKKGLFLYTPFYFLPIFLSFYLWKRSTYLFTNWVIFFCLITYVLSSWWMWFYGGSFSSRVYIDYLPIFALVLGLCIQSIKSVAIKNGVFGLILLLTMLCQIQSYQYRYYIIHYSEMNEQKYWDVFLDLNKKP